LGLVLLWSHPASAVIITVTTTSDAVAADGSCSLREALQAANSNLDVNECPAGSVGLDEIAFDIPGSGVRTISPLSALPDVTEPLIIDGYTQPDSRANGLEVGTDAVLLIELDGSNAGLVYGLALMAGASGSEVRGLVINRFRAGGSAHGGILLDGVDGATIAGNYLGTDPTGTIAQRNFFGINAESSFNVVIGGSASSARNVISGNGNNGIRLSGGASHIVQGNYVGVDSSGTAPLGNRNQGIRASAAPGSIIGGSLPGDANVISANADAGIIILASSVRVAGNFIGTDASGSLALGNTGAGVKLLSAGAGNTITRNSISSNEGLGIDLDADGVTPNDLGDADDGSNELQNFPLLGAVSATAVEGSLNSEGNRSYTLEFYSSSACDPSGHGEGAIFLGESQVTTDASGDATFFAPLTAAPATGEFVTATATNHAGSTSEFSPCVIAAAPVPALGKAGPALLCTLLGLLGLAASRRALARQEAS
jgi:CSLREA domain-containing protein